MGLAATYRRALAAHRQAYVHLAAASRELTSLAAPADTGQLADVAARLRRIGDVVTAAPEPAGFFPGPIPVRVGLAGTSESAAPGGLFPAIVPLTGGTHLAIDADARDPRVAALLRGLVVRLLLAAPPGAVRVATMDTAALGATFVPLRALVEAGVLQPPATNDQEVAALLDAAERHARTTQDRVRAAGGVPGGLPGRFAGGSASGGPASGGPAFGGSGSGDAAAGGPAFGGPDELLLVVAASAPQGRELNRLAALTHAGPSAGVCVLVAGYPPRVAGLTPPELGGTTQIRVEGDRARVGDPPGHLFSSDGSGLAVPVRLDGDPPRQVIDELADQLGEQSRRGSELDFTDLLPARPWTESSAAGLRTVIGRAGRDAVALAFDDKTPHWLVGGRTGAGKTVFLLDVLYGLAARYSPDELALYLLDFKEGISFTEFVPTGRDPSWIPHARAVGIESDREYGVAVLRELRRELNRRASAFKRHGVTKLADLPRDDGRPVPRVVAVIDEFHVLFAGNDAVAREAVALLEELARKGRSYGIHLVLASQSMSGIEALYGKTDSIFGQFPLRIALAGGNGVLDPLNDAAGALPVGSAVVNPAAGIRSANTVVRFPDAHASAGQVAALRHELWRARAAGSRPPAVFKGYESAHVEDDPTFAGLAPGGRRPLALVGRVVDVDLTSAMFPIDATPGRHLAVVGTSPVGADVLHAAAVSLARQHRPGTVAFLLAPLVAGADQVADETAETLAAAGHPVTRLDAQTLRDEIRKLAEPAGRQSTDRTYLVVFGMDAASGVLGITDASFRSGLDDLRTMLRQGPAYGVHLLGWWRGLSRLSDDIGGSFKRDDVACLVALNVTGAELGSYLGTQELPYAPRANRALLIDRHDQRTRLIVPFVRPGHEFDEGL
ncbi:FtsK/SpoIIIE domain-containing protein [Solwaraspora sp. WMMD1047]|uniref:FtsK/SpoIIIE domain-containing protein n=1 Tax=Solwaraspora sp. WMMD1047 TaxID=3016102 RepID=UPI0024171BEC|nr:FtsK/SpoIIIE domain-containing protein [Solwaraspora sp. WMMD1047]MDG4832046.1 FtsK/SpoIIIE domain-containing protein [Solwaraspora sp. WMMD1047]